VGTKAQEFLAKAHECERLALVARDRDVKTTLLELAAQWRELAVQIERHNLS